VDLKTSHSAGKTKGGKKKEKVDGKEPHIHEKSPVHKGVGLEEALAGQRRESRGNTRKGEAKKKNKFTKSRWKSCLQKRQSTLGHFMDCEQEACFEKGKGRETTQAKWRDQGGADRKGSNKKGEGKSGGSGLLRGPD